MRVKNLANTNVMTWAGRRTHVMVGNEAAVWEGGVLLSKFRTADVKMCGYSRVVSTRDRVLDLFAQAEKAHLSRRPSNSQPAP